MLWQNIKKLSNKPPPKQSTFRQWKEILIRGCKKNEEEKSLLDETDPIATATLDADANLSDYVLYWMVEVIPSLLIKPFEISEQNLLETKRESKM